MTNQRLFIRSVVTLLSFAAALSFCNTTLAASSSLPYLIACTLITGCAIATLLWRIEDLIPLISTRRLGTVIAGLITGTVVAQPLFILLTGAFGPTASGVYPSILLISAYICTLSIAKASKNWAIELPLIRLEQKKAPSSDLLIDPSALSDSRIVDAAATGVFDNQLIIPKAYARYLEQQLQNDNETPKVRKSLDTLQRLESMPHLGLRYTEVPLPKEESLSLSIQTLSRMIDARVLTAEASRLHEHESAQSVNLHKLSLALKPIMQGGETIELKIQRYGKEPGQGVGYLEDGTMVVVNGGGEYLNEVLSCTVLSVKHTSSGRMIFCNVTHQEEYQGHIHHSSSHHHGPVSTSRKHGHRDLTRI